MNRTALARIDLQALRHNLTQIRSYARNSKIMCVVKANAYGHGLLDIVKNLQGADGFAVSCLDEALQLRRVEPDKPICVFQGFMDPIDLKHCADFHLTPVIHQDWQLDLLEQEEALPCRINAWLKLTTGMNRLGLRLEELPLHWKRIKQNPFLEKVGLMTHMSSADEPDGLLTNAQLKCFSEATVNLDNPKSVANSATLLGWPDAHYDWVRPGIMLYGVSPIQTKLGVELGLKPVMTLKTRLIAINHCKKGETLGYGAEWQCPHDTLIGIAAIGYGDGYPRNIQSETPVLVNGQKAKIVGRVSMDMITIDLSSIESTIEVGADVVLWGGGLPVEKIAECAGTIPYELLCSVYGQVHYEYDAKF